MCRGHVKEAHRHHSDPDYTPVWKKNTQHAKDEELDELEDDEEDLSEDSDSEEVILQTEIITDMITDDETIVDWFP